MAERFGLHAAATAMLMAVPSHGAETAPQTPANALSPASTIPRRVPTSELARQPLLEDPKLSPDGTRILTRMSVGGEPCVVIQSLRGGAALRNQGSRGQ
jgi:hypothetical protein